MAKIIETKTKVTVYTLCKHLESLPEDLRPFLPITCHYCPACGQKLFTEAEVMKKVCSNCGQSVDRISNLDKERISNLVDLDNNYCTYCGEEFDEKDF